MTVVRTPPLPPGRGVVPTIYGEHVHAPGEGRSGFAVIDVETTGFSPEAERIVEVGVVVLDRRGVERSSFSTLLHPGRDPGPTHVHRITAAMVTGAPSFADILPYLGGQLSGRVLVGHNIDRFDLAFVRAEWDRAGTGIPFPAHPVTVDTLQVAQHHLGLRGRARLVECCERYGLAWDDHHTALGDARVTAALFGAMRAEVGDHVLGIDGLLDRAEATDWAGPSLLPPPSRPRTEVPSGSGRWAPCS